MCNSQNLIVQDLGQARPRSRKCSDVSASSSPEAVSGGLQAGPSEMVEGGAALSPPLHSLPLVLAPLMMSCCLMMMMNGFYWENGNRDQNLVCEIQWGCGLLPLYTISILETTLQIIKDVMENEA